MRLVRRVDPRRWLLERRARRERALVARLIGVLTDRELMRVYARALHGGLRVGELEAELDARGLRAWRLDREVACGYRDRTGMIADTKRPTL